MTAIYIQGADKSSTPTCIAHLRGSRLRNPTVPRLAATQLMDTKNWRRGWKPREERNGTSTGSMAFQPSEEGRD